MAVALENLIDLNLLTYYDDQIKRWVVNRIAKDTKDTIFTTRAGLPVEGQEGMLYVTEESILKWNGMRYVEVGNPQDTSNATKWGTF